MIEKLPSCLSYMSVLYLPSAADWKLDEPAWSGRMKITAKGHMAFIKLEDKNTGKQCSRSFRQQSKMLSGTVYLDVIHPLE